ncbi:MAG: hypothetical protein QXW71_02135 [Thermoplasmata archaeon]
MYFRLFVENSYELINLFAVKWIKLYKDWEGNWRARIYWEVEGDKWVEYILSEGEAKALLKVIDRINKNQNKTQRGEERET